MREVPLLYSSAFDEVARTRTTLNILPNLLTFEWTPPLHKSFASFASNVVFMHENIKHLAISLPKAAGPPLRPYFQDIVARMPNLTHLDLRMQVAMNEIEADAMELFRGLPMLQQVTLPNYHLTTKVVEELSKLSHLGVVQFEYGEEQGYGIPTDVQMFAPTLSQGAFPSLYDISLTANLADVTRFMSASFAPTNITSLYIDSPSLSPESPSTIHEFLKTIADNCQLLKSLFLALLNDVRSFTSKPSSEDHVTFETLRPILNCPNLVAFEMTHEYPLNLTLDDIEELASKWRSLESLLLNCEPPYLYHSALSLSALLPFACHCPELRHLGLFLNASAAEIPLLHNSKSFGKLGKLSVGVSCISEAGPIALFLSELCPLGCEIESGVTWYSDFNELDLGEEENGGLSEEISTRCGTWKKVGELLPLLTQLRMEERNRVKGLQSEVEDLRTRVSLLMDREKAMDAERYCVIL